MRRILVLAVLVVGCASGRLERAQAAYETCQRQMEARNWQAAVPACRMAAELDNSNRLYAQTLLSAKAEALKDRIHMLAEAQRQEVAAVRQDAEIRAARRQARALQEANDRAARAEASPFPQ